MRIDGIQFEQKLIREALTEREQALIKLLFFDGCDKSFADVLFNGLDLETENGFFRLVLYIYGYSRCWKGFPKEIIGRVKGIHRYYQVDNALKFTCLLEVLETLNNERIPAMLIKGGAMYVFYRKGSPRMMDDFDVVVPEEYFSRAAALFEKKGWERANSTIWSIDFVKDVYEDDVYIDLHKRVFKRAELSDHQIWERAIHLEFQGVRVAVPSPEDMLMLLFDDQIRNIFEKEHSDRRIKWFFDCFSIREKYPSAFAPQILRARSEDCFDTYYIQLALRILSERFPESLPQEELKACFPAEKEYFEWLSKGGAYMNSRAVTSAFPKYTPLTPRYMLLTPRYMLLAAQRWIDDYRFMGPEYQDQFGKGTFFDYFFWRSGTGNIKGALKKYLPRIQLREEKGNNEKKQQYEE